MRWWPTCRRRRRSRAAAVAAKRCIERPIRLATLRRSVPTLLRSVAKRDQEGEMDALKSVDELCAQHKLDVKQLAEKAGLDEQRVLAIVLGRWTPSPEERDKVAAVFGLTRDQIAWGHKTPIQHIYGSGPA